MSKIILPYSNEPIYDTDFYKDYGIFVKPITYPMSTKKIESLLEISKNYCTQKSQFIIYL